ncbi:Crp/Fnr family transcriptional regulator [Carboxylicivirga sediminis]|uniref:Crp/Fnr family transcriptional regulator n=1 Tax=Carboxylicivirga sediminis TaxID=2006564 RepID=A0A941IWH9_9BACT|nr:Crp/Fnr family transcriptional regulator [Carboxylicivirga sediminis]MBR8534598.1 Crp/Fnr family transcriptional regulator [Carboxylicivirga sediminis]
MRTKHSTNESLALLNSFSLFDCLSGDEKLYLADNIVHKELDSKTALYHEGCALQHLMLIIEGIVKQVKRGAKGKELVIRYARSGEILGFRSVMTNELACTTSEAAGPVKAGFIKKGCLLKLVRTNTNFAYKLLQMACMELEETQRFILNVSQKQIRERVAATLLHLADIFQLDEDNTLKATISRKEIASAVGTVPESVIRMLSEFKEDKLIELNGRQIRYIDIPKLKRMSYSSFYSV